MQKIPTYTYNLPNSRGSRQDVLLNALELPLQAVLTSQKLKSQKGLHGLVKAEITEFKK